MGILLSIWDFFFKQKWCIVCGKKDYLWKLKPEAFWEKHDHCEQEEGHELFFDNPK